MKHTFKTLLGLVLVVFALAGCSNPAGPEIPEIPEDNARFVKVEFRWSTNPDIGTTVGGLKSMSPRYLLGLRSDSKDSFVYEYPKNCTPSSYAELKKTIGSDNLYKYALEEVFGTKYYEEGKVIDLTQWTSKAKDLIESYDEETVYSHLCFLTEDIEREDINVENFFDEVIVGNEDIVIYVYWKCCSVKN